MSSGQEVMKPLNLDSDMRIVRLNCIQSVVVNLELATRASISASNKIQRRKGDGQKN